MIRSILNAIFRREKQTDKSENQYPEFVWSLTGNIVNEHEYGENKEIRRGSKHFSPGTKVYCIPEFGGMGHENITVIGIPRRSRKHIKVTLPTRLIENWRVKKVYHPHILKLLDENWQWSDKEFSRREALRYADGFTEYPRR